MLDTTVNRVSYRGGDSQAIFPIPFPFLASSHLVVTRRDNALPARTLLPGIDYIVNQMSDEEGELVLLEDPLPEGGILDIARRVPLTQDILFHNQGPNSPRAVEEALDKLTMVAQQFQDDLEDAAANAGAPSANELEAIRQSAAAVEANVSAQAELLGRHALRHARGGADAIRPEDLGVLPAPPDDGQPYLAAAGGWIRYLASGSGQGGGETATLDHSQLLNRDAPDQHPQSAIQHLSADLTAIRGGVEQLDARLTAKADTIDLPTVATASADGLLPAADKRKLDKLPDDLQAYVLTRTSPIDAKIDTLSSHLGPLATAADAPANGKAHIRRDGTWQEQAASSGSGGAMAGEIRLLPFRSADLPSGWYFCNGDRYGLATPQGIALAALPANLKSDWGMVKSASDISLPNLFSGADGYFLRPVDNYSRLPGQQQLDAIRNITGSLGLASQIGLALNLAPSAVSTFAGAFKAGTYGKSFGPSGYGYGTNCVGDLLFDASASVITASENRPLNIGMTPAIYLGV